MTAILIRTNVCCFISFTPPFGIYVARHRSGTGVGHYPRSRVSFYAGRRLNTIQNRSFIPKKTIPAGRPFCSREPRAFFAFVVVRGEAEDRSRQPGSRTDPSTNGASSPSSSTRKETTVVLVHSDVGNASYRGHCFFKTCTG